MIGLKLFRSIIFFFGFWFLRALALRGGNVQGVRYVIAGEIDFDRNDKCLNIVGSSQAPLVNLF